MKIFSKFNSPRTFLFLVSMTLLSKGDRCKQESNQMTFPYVWKLGLQVSLHRDDWDGSGCNNYSLTTKVSTALQFCQELSCHLRSPCKMQQAGTLRT